MLARPADREGPGREIFDALGMKLHHICYSAKGEIVCVAEGGAVNGASVAMMVTRAAASATRPWRSCSPRRSSSRP
jgi:hypothetical protein